MPDWDNQRDMELHPIEEVEDFEGIESLRLGEGDSIYFTPSGTPLRCELWFLKNILYNNLPTFSGREQITVRLKGGARIKEW